MPTDVENNRIVIDTNIVIKACIGEGSAFDIINKILPDGEFEVCISDEVLEEYQAVPQKKSFAKDSFADKYPKFQQKVETTIEILKLIATPFTPQQKFTEIADEDDNKFLELAVEADAFCIITDDEKHFNEREYLGVKIFRSYEFYSWWRRRD